MVTNLPEQFETLFRSNVSPFSRLGKFGKILHLENTVERVWVLNRRNI